MSELLESIAELEHNQWAHWTKYMLDNLTAENISRWKSQVLTPYSELTELEKDSDRKWAKIVIGVVVDKAVSTNYRYGPDVNYHGVAEELEKLKE